MKPGLIVAAALAVLLTGCAQQTQVPDSMQSAKQRVADTTLPSGWRVDCNVDDTNATKECFAGTFGITAYKGALNGPPFRIVFRGPENGPLLQGPFVEPGFQDWPGDEYTPTVRIDNNEPIHDNPALFREMDTGVLAKVEYWVWPTGPERMSVNLAGFHEAYKLLLTKAGSH
jgi:hypothetical protein